MLQARCERNGKPSAATDVGALRARGVRGLGANRSCGRRGGALNGALRECRGHARTAALARADAAALQRGVSRAPRRGPHDGGIQRGGVISRARRAPTHASVTSPTDPDVILWRLPQPTVQRLHPELSRRAEAERAPHKALLGLLIAEEIAHRTVTPMRRVSRSCASSTSSASPCMRPCATY